MIISLLLKTGFVVWVIFLIIPRFAARRNLSILMLEAISSIALFMAAEFFIPGAAAHKASHTHNFLGSFWFHLIVYFLLLSICLAVFFTREWIRNERLKRELIETQLSTELNFLKSQINPHFLFNTLNNLYSIAQRSGSEQLETGIYKLSGLMRYVIYETSAPKVPLSKEIEYIHDFIGLSKLRFTEDELAVSLVVNGPTNVPVAPMILIPFVENAFKHGVKIDSLTHIDINITTTPQQVIFECTNDVHNTNATTEQQSGIGLENVKRRLELLYPGKHKLEITGTAHKFKIYLTLTV